MMDYHGLPVINNASSKRHDSVSKCVHSIAAMFGGFLRRRKSKLGFEMLEVTWTATSSNPFFTRSFPKIAGVAGSSMIFQCWTLPLR